jgi:hypothetical protein
VIGVAIFRRKAPALAIAPRAQARNDAADAPAAEAARIGTGHGRTETSVVQELAFERATSAPAETVTLYYDSYANLVARGIIREPVPVAPLPQPFPGSALRFAPDPPG